MLLLFFSCLSCFYSHASSVSFWHDCIHFCWPSHRGTQRPSGLKLAGQPFLTPVKKAPEEYSSRRRGEGACKRPVSTRKSLERLSSSEKCRQPSQLLLAISKMPLDCFSKVKDHRDAFSLFCNRCIQSSLLLANVSLTVFLQWLSLLS